MIWRSGPLLLVSRGASFVVIDRTGAVTASYEPRTYSDEDDLWTWDHVVVGDRFYKRTTVEHRGDPSRTEELVLEGLVAVDDVATQGFVAAVLADDRAARESARAQAEREGEARVAAITGALEDHGLGEELARAQAALADRVRWYSDPLAGALLRSLVELARSRPDPSVIAAYARGCLHACFAHDVPQITNATCASQPALAAEIAGRARELDIAAENCEVSDSLGNARAYRAVARAVWIAASALGAPLP